MKQWAGFVAVFIFVFYPVYASDSSGTKYIAIPTGGFVPDERTAIRIAEVVFIPVYGEKKIRGEEPFKATLSDDTWTVRGSLPPGVHGGTAVANISRVDARIIGMTHEK